MRVLFCDDRMYRDTVAYQQLWQQHNAPAHVLYGALQLPENGIELKIMKYGRRRPFSSRVVAAIYATLSIIRQARHCDAIFSISYRGLELLMILRNLHLFKKPIFVWQHAAFQPASKSISNKVKTWMLGGIEEMFFFNKEIAAEAVKTGKVKRYCVIPFGADMEFYAPVLHERKTHGRLRFLSSGLENRDYEMLVKAFANQPVDLDIYTLSQNGCHNYSQILQNVNVPNIHVHILKEYMSAVQLRAVSAEADCIVISTLPLRHIYPCGLTSIVEAMALAKPIIATYNPWYGIDIEKEGIGFVAKTQEDWSNIIQQIIDNPTLLSQMGEKAYQLAQKTYNIQKTGLQISQEIMKSCSQIQ